jgi:hypothetical protein
MSMNNPQRNQKTSGAQINCPNRETRQLLRELVRQGFEVERRGSGHYLISKIGIPQTLLVSGTDVSSGVRGSWKSTLTRMGAVLP